MRTRSLLVCLLALGLVLGCRDGNDDDDAGPPEAVETPLPLTVEHIVGVWQLNIEESTPLVLVDTGLRVVSGRVTIDPGRLELVVGDQGGTTAIITATYVIDSPTTLRVVTAGEVMQVDAFVTTRQLTLLTPEAELLTFDR